MALGPTIRRRAISGIPPHLPRWPNSTRSRLSHHPLCCIWTGYTLIVRCSSAFSSVSPLHARSVWRKSIMSISSHSNTHFAAPSADTTATAFSYFDIGANLLDEKFTAGTYFGKVRHEPDLEAVLERTQQGGVSHVLVTAGTLQESQRAVEWVKTQNHQQSIAITFACTVGIHPTRGKQELVDPRDDGLSKDQVIAQLKAIVDQDATSQKPVVKALGELGLDYDRLEFTPKDIQHETLRLQLDAFAGHVDRLPLFLHNRNAGTDLLDVLRHQSSELGRMWKGAVHSFDDSLELAQGFMDMGFCIGINGCSLKTQENLNVVQQLPLDRILLETDCPYCEIKATHASFTHVKTKFGPKTTDKKFQMGSMVKGRNEPCQIVQIAEVIAGVKEIPLEQVATTCLENSKRLFGLSDTQQE